jgi:cytoskeletal protein CcmA (bactofilin family)
MSLSNPTAASTLGSTIKIKGELHGQEDIQISGQIEGEIRFAGNTVTISRSAQIDAGIHARRIEVEGTVNGNLEGSDEVVIRKTGRVEGNLKAPRVTLEDGATFRGSVDMRAATPKGGASTPAGSAASPGAPVAKPDPTPPGRPASSAPQATGARPGANVRQGS